MKNRHLFLFGGSPPFTKELGEKFVKLAQNKIAILFLEREGWQAYMPKYTSVFNIVRDVNFSYLPLSPSPGWLNELLTCTGIIIGGGDTEKYQEYLIGTDVGRMIQEMYRNGVPVAGFSAGALVSVENCVIPPIDSSNNEHLFIEGLGLLKDCVISVHYRKWNEEDNLKFAIKRTSSIVGYGIDDHAGIYFNNEELSASEGFVKKIQG